MFAPIPDADVEFCYNKQLNALAINKIDNIEYRHSMGGYQRYLASQFDNILFPINEY